MADITDAKTTSIPGEVEKVYFKCTQCGALILYLDRYDLEAGTPRSTDPELVAAVLAGKVKLIDRKCEKCFALSYDVYAPPAAGSV